MKFMKRKLNTNPWPFIHGTYVRKDFEHSQLILDPKGTYSLQLGKHRSTGDFKIDPNATITFKTWGYREDEEVLFGGNILVDPDEYEWVKQLTFEGVSGVYFEQENKNDYLKLMNDGEYEGRFDSQGISGKYKLVQDKVFLSFYEEEIELRGCSAVRGYGHAIFCSDMIGTLVKSYDKSWAVEEYVCQIDKEKKLTLYPDGFFFMDLDGNTMNGQYQNDKKHILLRMGGGQYIPLEKYKKGVLVDGDYWAEKT